MKKEYIVFLMILYLVVMGIIAGIKDNANVKSGIEPKYTIKIVNGSKVTYYGLGYKVIRYVSISHQEPFANNKGVKFGSWFMQYELPAYWNMNDYGIKSPHFIATIVEVTEDTIIVEPDENAIERRLGDRIIIKVIRPTSGINDFYVPGNRIKVTYNGILQRTYPVELNASLIELYDGD